jgi:hypothetical protein
MIFRRKNAITVGAVALLIAASTIFIANKVLDSLTNVHNNAD